MQVALECTHKQARYFRIVLDGRTVLVLMVIVMIWRILGILHII
ncbi:hypothetical protein [Polynucleobacter paneuropaeus]|nr:hypothetical protein [Polynucleobacter paneuropaeus]